METRMTESQWNSLSQNCKRELIKAVMIIQTDEYRYSLGANGDWWILYRRDSNNNCKLIDRWI